MTGTWKSEAGQGHTRPTRINCLHSMADLKSTQCMVVQLGEENRKGDCSTSMARMDLVQRGAREKG